MDRALFYAGLRKRDSGLFGTSLSQSQVKGLERLLNVWDKYYASDPIEFLAYNLATSYHETGATMQPIRENLNYSAEGLRNTFPKYFSGVQAAEYARQPQRIANRAYANRMGNGNEASGDGWRYRGEGDVQNTGKANAARATKELNALFNLDIDLVANPDQRGDPFVSAHSLFLGNKEGWWTGKKLGDFIKTGTFAEFKKARAVVNGSDQADKIAGYAVAFLAILKAAGASPRPYEPDPIELPPATVPKPAPPIEPIPSRQPQSLTAAILAVFALLFKKA